jgi:hypothetical protein
VTDNHCRSEPARDGGGSGNGMSTERTLSRAGEGLQGIFGWLGICGATNSQCGSEPARDGGVSGNGDVD